MKTAERRNAILKLLQNAGGACCSEKTGRKVWCQSSGNCSGYGGDTGLHTGDHFNDQGLCDGAGTALCKRI